MKELNNENFEEETKSGVTLVDFFAEWCGPCRMMTPVLDEVEKELKGKATVAKLDIDHSSAIAAKFQVTSVPTLVLFKDGKEIDRLIGVRDAEAIKIFISKAN
tara:strand:- start:343 stop:651 length:309 start_codon:yes stop_codon:yes gene_type:complete